MKFASILVLAAIVAGCSASVEINSADTKTPTPVKPTQPPPGFEIVCDGKGHYSFAEPNSGTLFSDIYASDTKQEAIDEAWKEYNAQKDYEENKKTHPTPHFTWNNCDN